MNEDFLDLLQALLEAGARFLVVGAHSMAVHGVPRATGDLDVWIHHNRKNAERAWLALQRFGAPVVRLGITQRDLAAPETVVQIGFLPPGSNLLTSVTGLECEEAWPNRTVHRVGSLEIPFLGRDDLIRNKRAMGRSKDHSDLEILERKPKA